MKKYQIKYYALIGCHKDPNQIYIGQTIRNTKKRFKEHKLKNYSDAFVIDESYSTDDESLDIENGWMDYYEDLGWKVISTKQNQIVRTLPDYVKDKKRKAWSGENNPKFGVDMSGENNPMYGKKQTAETCIIIGQKSLGNTRRLGTKHSAESINNMSKPRENTENMKLAANRDSTKIKRKNTNSIKYSVLQLDLQGNIINEFIDARTAANSLGKKGGSTIIAVCLGKQKTAYGYRWIKKKDYNDTSTVD